MDKVNTQFLWLGTQGLLNYAELKTRRVNAGRCMLEQKFICTSEPVSNISNLYDDDGTEYDAPVCIKNIQIDDDDDDAKHGYDDHGDNAHELLLSVHVEDNISWENLSLEEALTLLDDPCQLPSIEDFLILLKKCRKQRNVDNAMRLHMHVLSHGLESHVIIGNHLIPMLVHCNRMPDAQTAFSRLGFCNEHSWTALIFGCVDNGSPEQAVDLIVKMLEAGVIPSLHTYVGLLNACARLKQLGHGRIVHAKIIEESYENDVFIGNALVDMYAKCGSLVEAHKVFDMMPVHDVVSWTTLLGGYVDYGLDHEALAFLAQMHKASVLFNSVTFVYGLNACASLGDLEKGHFLHEEILLAGYEEDLYVGNALVDMYSKCGRIKEACAVFNKMPTHDEVSWNALITGHVEYGDADEAFTCWRKMKKQGKSPNVVTFVYLLKACGRLKALDKGREMHAEIEKKGFQNNIMVCNALLDMYFRCGSVREAEMCFHNMSVWDVVSWTTLMAGYAECGHPAKALRCLQVLQQEGLKLDAVAYIISLRCCSSLRSLDMGKELHEEINRLGFSQDLAVANSLVDMYSKCGSLQDAQDVFQNLSSRNVISWTAIIAGFAENGMAKDALENFEQMKREGVLPNALTYSCVLKACSSSKAVSKGLEVHHNITIDQYEEDLFVANGLIDMYAKFGFLSEAQDMFGELPAPDVVAWTALITGYASHGSLDKAMKHFEAMQMEGITPESISFNPLIMGYSRKGQARKPLALFKQMSEKGVLPDRVTFLCVLRACANGSSLEMGRRIHAQVHVIGVEDIALSTMLIDMYSKLGSIINSQKVFDALETKNCYVWTALMKAYARKKDNQHVLHLFERMRDEAVEPDGIAFLIVLNACRSAKLVDKGQLYFDMMIQEYGITPTAQHRDSMVNLLERCGRVDEALAILL